MNTGNQSDKQTRLPEKKSRKIRDMCNANMGLNRVISVANDLSQKGGRTMKRELLGTKRMCCKSSARNNNE